MKELRLEVIKETLLKAGKDSSVVERFIERMKRNQIKEVVELNEEEATIAEGLMEKLFAAYEVHGDEQITPAELQEYYLKVTDLDARKSLADILARVEPVTLKTTIDPSYVTEDKYLFLGFFEYLQDAANKN